MNKATIYNKIVNASQAFEQEHQREPSNDELAEILEMKPEELATLRATLTFHSSVDTPIGDDDETTSLDLMQSKDDNQPDKNLIDFSLTDELEHSLQILSDREKEIIRYYFGMNDFNQAYSLDEIGTKLNLTRERVRQVKDKALKKIRRNKNTKELRSFFD
jgi:RNA polymerase primary sigma factor